MNTAIRCLKLIASHRIAVGSALALAALGSLLNLLIPVSIRTLIDHLGGTPLFLLPTVLLLVFVGQALANTGSAMIMSRVGVEVARDLRHRLYARLQRARLSFLDKTPAGAIISRVMEDVAVVQGVVGSQVLSLISDLCITLVIAGCLAATPRLFLVVVLLVPIYVVFFRFFTRRIRTGAAAVRKRLDEIFAVLKQKCDGALIVKAHAREEDEMTSFAAQISAAHHLRLKVERTNAAFSSVNSALSGVGTCVLFAVGAWEAANGRMTPGEVVSAAALTALLFAPATRLADIASVAEQAAASLDRLDEILAQRPAVADPCTPLGLPNDGGIVEFDHVSFGYDADNLVLRDICLHIEPGMKVAIVGPTGSGKTTLLNLLLRFYDPASGEIRIAGKPLPQLALADLRRLISLVPQEAVIFRRSLADNIRYGAADASDAQVMTAAKAAQIDELVQRLPNGYATLIGEGAFPLSQGERQQVAIARALCKNPALVALDEAMSCLDAPSEALIQSALANLLQGRTSFIIAHRLASVVHADLIVVLDRGHIVQAGTHAELIGQTDGLYCKLHQCQFDALSFAA